MIAGPILKRLAPLAARLGLRWGERKVVEDAALRALENEATIASTETLPPSLVTRVDEATAAAPTSRSAGITPGDLGLTTIAEDPKLLRHWNNALRDAAASTRGNGYTRYLADIAAGRPITPKRLREAFDAVNGYFLKTDRAEGYEIGFVHHWNFPKTDFPEQIVEILAT